jgi:NAD(P)-dependent dehydrogenase (short-subunit alcohol dehydrogenase family)
MIMFNPMSLEGRRVLVTGASSGIGRAISVYLSRLGAQVVIVARDVGRLEETLQMMEGEGHRLEAFNLADAGLIPKWMKGITKEFGTLHGLVHSAGIQRTLPVRAMKVEGFEELMRVNVTAAFALAKGFRQRGVTAEAASLVFISSVMGLVAQAGISAYCCSKGALISLAKSLALEFARQNIRVNCIAPGDVETQMTIRRKGNLTPEQIEAILAMHPLGPGLPEDVAASAAFLLADTGKWITGTCLTTDGGYTAH